MLAVVTAHLLLVILVLYLVCFFFFFKQKTAYEMRISDWSSDVCSSDLSVPSGAGGAAGSHVPGCDAAVHTSTACAVPFLDVQSDGRLHEMAYRLHACRWTVHRRWLCFQHGSSLDRKSTRLNSSH